MNIDDVDKGMELEEYGLEHDEPIDSEGNMGLPNTSDLAPNQGLHDDGNLEIELEKVHVVKKKQVGQSLASKSKGKPKRKLVKIRTSMVLKSRVNDHVQTRQKKFASK
jgi:hypothetical protein